MKEIKKMNEEFLKNQPYRGNKFASYSETKSSNVYDNQHQKREFNKSIIFLFLKISFSVSLLMSIIYFFSGDLIGLITFAIAGFFGTFVILTVIFYIERLYEVILNKIKKKKLKEVT